jgi:adenylate kinase family enzyme
MLLLRGLSSVPTKRLLLECRQTLSSVNTPTLREFQTWQPQAYAKIKESNKPGSKAFAECETDAIKDLFNVFAKTDGDAGIKYLDHAGVRELLKSIGERPDERTLQRLFKAADFNGDGVIELHEFLGCADTILGDAPARIVLVVGGPGSGKGLLCSRLEAECNVVHLSSGDLLRDEVQRDTPLGRECAAIMERGGLVSSAVIVTLIRRHMRGHPGKRVLLDGFPRSPENAHDLVELCGVPELALHLDCDDTILLERIIGRGRKGQESGNARADDNFDTALHRLRTYHKHHRPTIQWLQEQRVPIGK